LASGGGAPDRLAGRAVFPVPDAEDSRPASSRPISGVQLLQDDFSGVSNCMADEIL